MELLGDVLLPSSDSSSVSSDENYTIQNYLSAKEIESLTSVNNTLLDDFNIVSWDDIEAMFNGSLALSNLSKNSSLAFSDLPEWPRWPRWKDLSLSEKEAYLLKAHGPKHLAKDWAIGMTLFYIFLFFTGVPGNLLTCLIIFMNSYMRASPNYFLFNLAIADIMTLMLGKLSDVRVH